MKQIEWMGKSRTDLKEFPDRVRRAIGHALHSVQTGVLPAHAKVFTGFGNAKIWEIRENDSSGTYRAVYTASSSNLPIGTELKAPGIELF